MASSPENPIEVLRAMRLLRRFASTFRLTDELRPRLAYCGFGVGMFVFDFADLVKLTNPRTIATHRGHLWKVTIGMGPVARFVGRNLEVVGKAWLE